MQELHLGRSGLNYLILKLLTFMSDIQIKVGNLYASIKSLKTYAFPGPKVLGQNHYHSHDGKLFFKENLNPTKN